MAAINLAVTVSESRKKLQVIVRLFLYCYFVYWAMFLIFWLPHFYQELKYLFIYKI